MGDVSVTSKGQVTIPKDVRDALGITTGTRVRFEAQGVSARLTVARKRKVSRVEDGPKIFNYKGPRRSLEDMEQAIIDGMTRTFPRKSK